MDVLKKIAKYKNLGWFILSFFFFVLFIKLFDDAIIEKSVVAYDVTISDWIYSLRTPFLNEIMKIITTFANGIGIIVFLFILFTILFFIKKRRYILQILVSSIFGYVFVAIMKILVQRPRPEMNNALITEVSFSFPSGHAMISVAVYGLVLYFLIHISKEVWKKVLILLLGILLIGGIGFSRIYLGVHWPTDVLASYLLGGSWLCFLVGYIRSSDNVKRLLSR